MSLLKKIKEIEKNIKEYKKKEDKNEMNKKEEKKYTYRTRLKAFNIRTTEEERREIKETLKGIKLENKFKSDTEAVMFLIEYYKKDFGDNND